MAEIIWLILGNMFAFSMNIALILKLASQVTGSSTYILGVVIIFIIHAITFIVALNYLIDEEVRNRK